MTREEWIKAADAAYDAYGANDVNYNAARNAYDAARNAYNAACEAYDAACRTYRSELARINEEYPQ